MGDPHPELGPGRRGASDERRPADTGSVVPDGAAVIRPAALPAAALGLAAGVTVTGVWALLYGASLTPFPPFDLGDALIRLTPGELATWTIERLGARAQPLALAGGVLLWLAGWAALAPAVARAPGSLAARLAPLAALPFILLLARWSEGGAAPGRLVWLLLAFGLTLAAGGELLASWLDRLTDALREQATAQPGSWLDQAGDYTRRELLRQVALVALVGGSGGVLGGRLLRSSAFASEPTSAGLPLATTRPATDPTPVPGLPLPAGFDAPAGVRERLTSNAEFYVVDISTRDPRVAEDGWSLRVHGLVERELLLTWSQLLALPAVELDGTLMCISYEFDNGLISSTRWTGVPLHAVLELAGVDPAVVDVVCRGANGYSDSLPLAKALEPTTLLAYGMNGETLPTAHGFPCRVYASGLYGEKHVKWLEELELVDYDYQGYWQERGWTDIALVNTVAIIDTPLGDVAPVDGVVPVGGIGYAGNRGVSAVELRVDDGEWLPASVEPYAPPLLWQRWRFEWRAAPGRHRLSVRATDGEGVVQDETPRPPHPDGSSGLHSVNVNVW